MKLRKRLHGWWRMWMHNDPDCFPYFYEAAMTRARYADNLAWERRVEYVRRMSGGYPTGEKP